MIRVTDGYSVSEIQPVTFIEAMSSDSGICDAARVSFHKLADSYSQASNERLLDYLASHNHWSPFAHAIMKFRFTAPIFLARQFVKHQVGFSWNEVSRRYVDDDPTFFVPESWRKRPENMKQGSVLDGAVPLEDMLLKKYVSKMREHAQDYKYMLSQDIAPEQIRMVMPQCMMTEWIWTGSLYAWARFVALRSSEHAQQECYKYTTSVLNCMYDKFPWASESLCHHYINKEIANANA